MNIDKHNVGHCCMLVQKYCRGKCMIRKVICGDWECYLMNYVSEYLLGRNHNKRKFNW